MINRIQSWALVHEIRDIDLLALTCLTCFCSEDVEEVSIKQDVREHPKCQFVGIDVRSAMFPLAFLDKWLDKVAITYAQ